jgi:hypothetical protein
MIEVIWLHLGFLLGTLLVSYSCFKIGVTHTHHLCAPGATALRYGRQLEMVPSRLGSADTKKSYLRELVSGILAKEGCRETKVFSNSTGLVLASSNARACIESLKGSLRDGARSSIKRVPVDIRANCKSLLLEHIRDREQHTLGRRPLLCTAATRGLGKTVLQAFNLCWFVNYTRGIGIETTFNDDQDWLLIGRNTRSIGVSVALRMLHRMIDEYIGCSGDTYMVEDDIIDALNRLSNPILDIMDIVREFAGASPQTKVMVTVDELVKGCTHVLPSQALSYLCRTMDDDKSRTLHLSASIYGCKELGEFTSDGSKRPLFYQSLDPVIPVLAPSDIHLAPPLLQPFYDRTMRCLLPSGRSQEEFISASSRLSTWLINAAGHPRRLMNLFEILGNAEYRVPAYFGRKEAGHFASSLKSFMHEYSDEYVLRKIASNAEYDSLATLPNLETALEQISGNVAKSFELPKTGEHAKALKPFLLCSESGYCQFLSYNPDSLQDVDRLGSGFAYIPLPALLKLRRIRQEMLPDKEVGPKFEALTDLALALSQYGHVDWTHSSHDKGKLLENVAKCSLLLYARSNKVFHLSDLCAESLFDEQVALLGDSVQMWNDVDCFPMNSPFDRVRPLQEQIQQLINGLLQENVNGAVFHPKCRFNMGGDLYGLFRSKGGESFELVVVQAKNWFRDVIKGAAGATHSVANCWRRSVMPFESPVIEFVGKDGNGQATPNPMLLPTGPIKVKTNGNDAIVNIRYILFTSNKPDQLALPRSSGVITTQSMRRWLPTAAYACEHAHLIQEIFAPSSDSSAT